MIVIFLENVDVPFLMIFHDFCCNMLVLEFLLLVEVWEVEELIGWIIVEYLEK